MRSARVDPATVDATAVAFRLAPRINAAGRLGRPDLALELLLTDDRSQARELANTLEELNRERQGVEERILREAVATVESWPAEARARRGYVLWDEGWHEGVIGIVASRLVERFHRPVVLVARSGEGWKGSGRSISDFDLHGGLAACAEHLERFGGHRAAAGLTITEEQLERVRGCVRAPRGRGARRRRPAPPHDDRRDRAGRRADARPRAGARPSRAVRARQPRADAARRERRGDRGEHRRRGEASPLPRPPAGPRRRLGDRVRPGRTARPPPGPEPVRRRVPAQGEPLERHRRAAARRTPRVRRAGHVRRAPRVARRAVAGGGGRLDARRATDLRRARPCRRDARASCSSRRASAPSSSVATPSFPRLPRRPRAPAVVRRDGDRSLRVRLLVRLDEPEVLVDRA